MFHIINCFLVFLMNCKKLTNMFKCVAVTMLLASCLFLMKSEMDRMERKLMVLSTTTHLLLERTTMFTYDVKYSKTTCEGTLDTKHLSPPCKSIKITPKANKSYQFSCDNGHINGFDNSVCMVYLGLSVPYMVSLKTGYYVAGYRLVMANHYPNTLLDTSQQVIAYLKKNPTIYYTISDCYAKKGPFSSNSDSFCKSYFE